MEKNFGEKIRMGGWAGVAGGGVLRGCEIPRFQANHPEEKQGSSNTFGSKRDVWQGRRREGGERGLIRKRGGKEPIEGGL